MSEQPQNFANHAKMVPGYHYVTTGLVLVLLVFTAWRAVTDFTLDNVAVLLLVVALVHVGFYTRAFPLGVQDRLIRLEETLRMQRLFPDDLQPAIHTLSTPQFIGLRFASDDELEELTRKVLQEGITDRTEIKKLVRDWRADHERI